MAAALAFSQTGRAGASLERGCRRSELVLCKSVFEVKYGRSNHATPLLRFLRELQFPQSCADGRRLHILFSTKMMGKHAFRNCIVGNASMQLSLYKILEYWAAEDANDCPELLEHCVACKTIDIPAGSADILGLAYQAPRG